MHPLYGHAKAVDGICELGGDVLWQATKLYPLLKELGRDLQHVLQHKLRVTECEWVVTKIVTMRAPCITRNL